MNRSRGPIPPQTDHPDEWPELTTSEQGQQREQYAPLSHQTDQQAAQLQAAQLQAVQLQAAQRQAVQQQATNQPGGDQYGHGQDGGPQAGQYAAQQQGAAAPNDQALNGWQRPVMLNDETTGRPAVQDQQAAGQVAQGGQATQGGQGHHIQDQHQSQDQQFANAQQQGYQPISSEAGGFPVADPAQPIAQGHDAPPAYAQQPQYTAPVGTEFPAPPEFPAPQEYTAPPEFTAPSEYTAPPEYTAPAEYTQPPQNQLAAPPVHAALPAHNDGLGDEPGLQFERYAPSPTLATAPDVMMGQNGDQGSRLGDLGHAADAGTGQWQQAAAPTGNPNHSYDPAAQNPAPHNPALLSDETANYDLARYAPIQNAAAGYTPGQGVPDQPHGGHGAAEPSYEQSGLHEQTGHAPQWNDPNEQTGVPVQQHDGQPDAGFEHAAMAPEGHQSEGHQHDVRQHQGHQQDYNSSALEDNYDEPPNGGRGLLIAASLVGAIAIGGALAYGYKHFGSTGSTGSNNLRTIVADNSPVKVKPKSPGGRIFRNKDRKVFSDRLRSGQGTGTRNNGVRKVPTLVITRNGNVAPPTARPAVRVAGGPSGEAPRLAVPGVFVPGLTMTAPRVAPQRRVIRPIATAPPSRPVQIAPTQVAVLPKARPLPPRAPIVQPRVQAPSSSRVIIAAPVRTNPQPSVSVSPSAAPAFAGASGYVAWISSSKDKVRTLASFASLQQKFPSLLAGKQPEIQKIVITKEGRSKGTWYRLRIGPPASKDATRALCTALVAKKGARECHVRKFR